MINLLIVDDEPLVLDIAKTYLEKTGDFTVDTVASAREALEMMEPATYDAIVSDYEMPEMDGIEFLKTVRGGGSDIPFIIFTGKGREEVVIEAINNGADFYMQKGGQPKAQFVELAHKIRHAVRERESEHELSKAYRQFQNIIEFLPDATFVIDHDGQVIAWNKAIEEMTGVLEVDVLGRGDYAYAEAFYGERRPLLVDIITTPDEGIESRYSSVKRDDGKIYGEVYLPGIYDGKGGFIWATASLLYGGDGNVIGGIESIRDISEKRKAELDLLEGFDRLNAAQDELAAQNKRLEESEERYRNVVEGQTEFISRFLPDGTHVFVNEAYCRYFGKRREEIMGDRFVPVIPSEDGELVKNHFASLSPDHPFDMIEHRIIMPDGEVRWQNWNDRAIFDETGTVIEYLSVGRDITDRKRAEEELQRSESLYRTLFESTRAPTVILGEDTTILWANSAYENLSGFSKEEVQRKKTLIGFVVKEDLESVREYHRLWRSDPGTAPKNYEFRFIDRSGGLHDIYLTIQMIPGTEMKVASMLDITDRKAAERALDLTNKKLQLLSSITRHDILNQVTALVGYTDILGEVLPDDPEIQNYIERITKATSAVERQITFTRDYEDLGVDPSRWQRVGDVAQREASGCADRAINVSIATGTLEVFADPMLGKVFHNLFDNAVRHGGHVTEISVTCREDEGGNVVIAVEDDGVGVPAEMKEQIFRHGFGRNTGYGLFLIQEILAITGMSIRETGEEGKGACFEITVPSGVWRRG